ncbi:hypothetical protein HEK616_42420 [Streptomyces nigrescens]|uniref:Uncharacterized protein n=1 Tax=Streptomyces nigrescens TaxID=1920 RepID=A0ABM7ZWL7_STRNI|nr:hypothetical protein [Streptomyces nigrescens]BDM70755.1 hypothetical protein HEK616_42420 [Streptomyces nigrescens]
MSGSGPGVIGVEDACVHIHRDLAKAAPRTPRMRERTMGARIVRSTAEEIF